MNGQTLGSRKTRRSVSSSRIQKRNREAILAAALGVFAEAGYSGATLDRIARAAGLSKPNLLYYFRSKDAIYTALLQGLLDTWLDPLRMLDPEGDPVAEILGYVRRKLDLARDYPLESRLFAYEIMQGAPRIRAVLEQDLRSLVEERAGIIRGWIDRGRIAPVDPVHLIFSVWALTQHYADFDVQVRAVLGETDPFPGAEAHLRTVFERILAT
ncbi:TetR family transcriptional regulator C-terminal domain-containing protein [Histidinibacterium lentulum]|uniref:TetR family transcriptional regulator n=1 Tax=Histidinibacterium lentulum TaxID=2480588 RepID=A0A3N2R5Y1_9RHOB|nr:TetR family transcriptional regulator C-terminal domain-containing protein [Histidinibacterium lentulum]ROU02895.1 TetR family transcriptional regulator [Histidinibacterium lentulum]